MPRVVRLAGLRKWPARALRMLRDDLWTWRADPLPPSVWLRWVPHGLVWLVAFGTTVANVAWLGVDGYELGMEYALVFGLTQGGAVVLAMRRPIPAWWLSTVVTVVVALAARPQLMATRLGTWMPWPWGVPGLIAHALVMLLLALRVPARVSVEALAVTALATYVLQVPLGAWNYQPTGVLAVALFAGLVLLGTALRGRRVARSELVEQASLTAGERARRTVLEERSRIARELHDVVAHHMSVISIQAQVAPHLVTDPPEELKENLAGIRQNALEALTELRRVLGVLRSEHPDTPHELGAPGTGTAPHAPQPTLDRLGTLIENTRAAGLTVTADTLGEPRPLPPGVELSAYRITQEALSNALRHAPGSTVHVELVHLSGGLQIRVVNSAPKTPVPPSPGVGHGLLGMRERAAMLGGTVVTHATAGGGYAVTAFLPRTGATATEPEDAAETRGTSADTSPGAER